MSLAEERGKIDAINHSLVDLLLQRFAAADEISRIKKAENLPILNQNHETEVLAKIDALTNDTAYADYIKNIFITIMDETKKSEDK
ncbi:chorismate mutase [Fructilactobacillus sp. Tb1]|uniref:chorismate mutase n=1 Tax=Fructilactobacillus sp. Tb1 TaxID=3422304 RepID=UPI003D26EFD4